MRSPRPSGTSRTPGLSRGPLRACALLVLVLSACGGAGEADPDTARAPLIDLDGDGWGAPLDCDDSLPERSPDATELCNGLDDDCDGVIDDNALDGTWVWLDYDRDGWGSATTGGTWCGDASIDARPWVTNHGDCDDEDSTRSPSAVESCARDGDDDCDGNTNDADASGCRLWYEDRDGDGAGSEASSCLCEAEGSYAASAPGDCDDQDRSVVTGCAFSGARSVSEADSTVYGATPAGEAGSALAGAGDIDGDGAIDLLIGGKTEAAGGARWWLLRGPFAGDRDLAAASATFDEPLLSRVSALACAGGSDLDGDGAPELVFAASGTLGSTSSVYQATLYLLAGPVSGTLDLARADATFLSATGVSAGMVPLALPGDTDGDGLDDVLLGHSARHAAYVLRGPIEGALSPSDASLVLSGPESRLGASVAAAGDLDGDGLADFAVGAPETTVTAGLEGQVWVVDAAQEGVHGPGVARATIAGRRTYSRLGTSVAGAGDVDGDGYDDVWIGGYGSDGRDNETGITWLFRGPVRGSLSVADAHASLTGASAGDEASRAICPGDLDQDGRPDLLIGAPGAAYAGRQGGAGYVFLSPVVGALLTTDADLRLYGLVDGDRTGAAVAGIGDINADGVLDLALGAPRSDLGGVDAGNVFLFHGAAE